MWWSGSYIVLVFNRIVSILLYGVSKTGNPVSMRGEILQTLLVKNAPDIFRIKTFCSRRRCVNIISSLHSLHNLFFPDTCAKIVLSKKIT